MPQISLMDFRSLGNCLDFFSKLYFCHFSFDPGPVGAEKGQKMKDLSTGK